MKSNLKFLALVALITILVKAEDPTPNSFPTKFMMNFTEHAWLKFGGNTTTNGTYYYDYSTKRHRLERDNGKDGDFCGNIFFFEESPCHQIVAETGAR